MTSKSDLMKSCGITAVVHEVGSYDSDPMCVQYPEGVYHPMKKTAGGWELEEGSVVIPAGAEFTVERKPRFITIVDHQVFPDGKSYWVHHSKKR